MTGITVTDNAIAHIGKYLNSRKQGIGIRLGVRTSGCSGMSYVLEFADEIDTDDNVFKFDSIQVLVDPKSLVYLEGIELDYTKEGLNEGFKFNNPNVSSECGCGESFNI